MFLFRTFIWNRLFLGDLLTACKFHPYHHFWAGIQFFLHKGEVWDELTARRETREVQPQSNTHTQTRARAPPTHSAYTQFGCMIYELCPRVAGFIFLLLTAPSLWGLAPLWDEGKEKPDFFDPWIHQKGMSRFSLFFFSLWWSGEAEPGVSRFDVSNVGTPAVVAEPRLLVLMM